MPKALDESSEPVNILYYGDGGTGKTTAIAHLAKLCKKGEKIVLIDAESGIKARALKQYGIPLDKIEIYPDRDADEEISYEGLEALWLQLRERDDVIGVGWDSVTEIYQALLSAIVARAYKKAQAQGKDRDPSFVALEDYGIMTQQMRSLVRRYRDLPMHFAMSALAKRDQDDDGSVAYNPQVTAKLGLDLIGWVDIVCVTQTVKYDDGGEDEYRGVFRPSGKWRGKDRFKMLPRGIVNPTMDRIVQYVDGELTADEDPVMQAAKERAQAQTEQEPVPA